MKPPVREPAVLDATREIGARVRAYIQDPTVDDFDALARDIFTYQFRANEPYADYCRRRGVGPDDVRSWRDIPPLPVSAFKEVSLTCAPPRITFRTSGTSEGGDRRGEHPVVDLDLYAESVLAGLRQFVVPDRDRVRVLSLVPSAEMQADSSLSYMASIVIDRVGDAESRTYTHDRELLYGAIFSAVDRAVTEGVPVLLFSTTLALVPLIDAAREAGLTIPLPAGSRLVDTGGAKGAGREFDEERLLDAYREVFSLPAAACINEYGMTELLSQYYNPGFARAHHGEEPVAATPGPIDRAVMRSPHWLRPRVLDPDTMHDVTRDGERGLLAHVDLANCHSVVAIVTDDVGVRLGDGAIRLEGRRPGAASRGCSIAMDEWLR